LIFLAQFTFCKKDMKKNTLRAIFFTIASEKCGSCKKGAIPSGLPPLAFRALNGTAYTCGIHGDEQGYEQNK
jgi:hypothetical protein